MRSLVKTDDWWAVWIGLFVFILSLATIAGADVLGWAAQTNVWLGISKAVSPVAKPYAGVPGILSIILSYLFLQVLKTIAMPPG